MFVYSSFARTRSSACAITSLLRKASGGSASTRHHAGGHSSERRNRTRDESTRAKYATARLGRVGSRCETVTSCSR
jgi:hypothetical protein